MAIFNQSDNETNGSSQTTIIAEGTIVNGEIEVETELSIFGKFTGDIKSTSTVTVGSRGFSSGTINANKLVINGAFDGEATCDTISILENGVANGTIHTNKLIIDDGGCFEGESRRIQNSTKLKKILKNIDSDTKEDDKKEDKKKEDDKKENKKK